MTGSPSALPKETDWADKGEPPKPPETISDADAQTDAADAAAVAAAAVPHTAAQNAWRRVAQGVIFILAVGLVVRALTTVGLDRSWDVLRAAGPVLALILLPFLVGMILDTMGWWLVLRGLGRPPGARPLLTIRLACESLMLSLPAGPVASDVAKVWLLTRCGIAVPQGVTSVAVKKVLAVISHALFLTLALVLTLGTLRALSLRIGWGWGLPLLFGGVALSVLVTGLVLLFAMASGRMAERLRRALFRVPNRGLRAWLARHRARFAGADGGARMFLSGGPRVVLPVVGLCLLHWLCDAFETFLILRLLGLPIDLSSALGCEALSSILRALAMTLPGGLGLVDLAYLGFPEVALGADAAVFGAALVLAKRAKEVFWIAVGYLLLWRLRRLKSEAAM